MAGFANRVSFDRSGTSLTQETVEAALRELVQFLDAGPYALVVGGGSEKVVSANSGAAYDVDLTQGNIFNITMTDDCTFTLSGVTPGRASSFTLVLTQDGVGGHFPTWFANTKWSYATPSDLSQDPGVTDVLTFFTLDGGATVYGFQSGIRMA